MKKIMIICFVLIFSGKAFSQTYDDWRSQYIKWNVGLNYNGGLLKKGDESKWINKYTATLSADVALSKIFYFDSGELFLQPFAEISLPIKNPYNSEMKFNTYGGGVNLKKYLNLNYEKSRYYIILGGKVDYVVSNVNYNDSYGNEKQYKSREIDYVINAGAGVNLTSTIEIFAMYSKGLKKIYILQTPDELSTLNTATIGVKIGLNRNWWFSK